MKSRRGDAATRRSVNAEEHSGLRVPASPRLRVCFSSFIPYFFVAALAIKFKTETRRATFFRKYPEPGGERRIVSDMLAMPAIQNCTPVVLVVFLKARDLLFHSSLGGRT